MVSPRASHAFSNTIMGHHVHVGIEVRLGGPGKALLQSAFLMASPLKHLTQTTMQLNYERLDSSKQQHLQLMHQL